MNHNIDRPLIIDRGHIHTNLYCAAYQNPDTGLAVESLFREMGSPRAFLCEILLAHEWRADYYRKNQSKGADLIPRCADKRPLEIKTTSRSGGVDLQPSGGKGMDRLPKTELFFQNCLTTDYVVVDSAYLADSGNLRYVVLSGEALLHTQKHRFSKKETGAWFSAHPL